MAKLALYYIGLEDGLINYKIISKIYSSKGIAIKKKVPIGKQKLGYQIGNREFNKSSFWDIDKTIFYKKIAHPSEMFGRKNTLLTHNLNNYTS